LEPFSLAPQIDELRRMFPADRNPLRMNCFSVGPALLNFYRSML